MRIEEEFWGKFPVEEPDTVKVTVYKYAFDDFMKAYKSYLGSEPTPATLIMTISDLLEECADKIKVNLL